jgi:hypothetical protein
MTAGNPVAMAVRSHPHLMASLRLDTDAPRGARYHVCQVDSPSPDLRDAVMLLTSEIVTRAVRQSHSGEDAVELRVWMPPDVVRVELVGSTASLFRPPWGAGPHYEHSLLDNIADRWSIDVEGDHASIWFEIDRLDADEGH